MAALTLRSALTRGLTNDEVDANLVALNNELATKVNQAGARSAISVSGSLSYNATTGVISYTTPVTSVAGKTGAVTLTKSDVGLSVVENKTSSTIRSEITSGNVIGALGFTPPATDGSGASGTWGISVSGNAATASSASKWASARTLTLTGDVTGSVSMDGSGNVSMSTAVGNDSHLHTQLYREDNRTLAPSDLGAGYMRFGFTSWANNSSSPYADFIHLRSYTDSSGGADNLVMFRKSAPGMRIWQQAWGSSTAYSSYVDVLDSSNYTSWVGNGAMTVTAGSGLTGGGQVGTANQSGASSITISHADTSAQGSVNNSGATVIQDVTLDGYGHVTGLASVALTYATVGAPSTTGTNASGTWGISISGNAASASTTDNINGLPFYNRYSSNALAQDSYQYNGLGYVTGVSQFGQTDGAMYAASYSTSWVHQIYGDFRTGQVSIRGKNSGTWQAWRIVLDSGNYTSYVGNGAMTVTAGSGLTGGGQVGTANQSGASSITISHADTSAQGSVNNSGATVIQDVTLDGYGHVTGLASVALTYATVGAPSTTGTNASGTWAISISGNAATASKWATARTLTLTGDVTGSASVDGSGNVSMTTAVVDNSHNHTNYLINNGNAATTGYLQAEGFVNAGTGSLSIFNPQNANYATSSSTITGAIRVRLPVSWTNTMMRMSIRIYEYTSGEGFDVVCGGYNYGSGYWTNTFAYILGSPNVNRNFNVRFGHDGTYCCIYIGETNSAWSYPQVAVTQFVAGYSSYAAETWNDNWDVGFVTAFGTVSSTISNAEIGRYLDGNTIITTAGSGLSKSNYTLSHADTSSQASVNNSGATVIQDVTLDTYGHVTGLASKTIGYADVGAPSTTGTNASGTWGISISGSSASTTGNAATATALATARTINGVSFNGTANITITAAASDVYSWAKASTKPSYTYSEVGAAAASHSHSYLPLSGGTLTGDIIFGSSDRDNSPMGTYDSYKTQQIWSMGAAYRNSSTGANFGNLYGASYKHTNNATGGTMAGGHQFVWCQAGGGTAALGDGVWTSGNVTAYSDERLKTDWATLPTDYVEQLAQVLSGTYTRIDTGIRQIGVGAHSLKGVAPDGVVDGEYLSVAYGNVALASAVELAKRVVKLGAQIDHLTSIVENLTKA